MDKNKIIEGAAKLVAKGAYDKAIKEYQKVLESDPRDVRILQKMGELYQKKNDNVQASHYFTKVAESYSSDGFFLKAVALYKQVLKLNPHLVEVNLKLAELHQQLQLLSEATAYYQLVANHYDKAGDVKSSLDTVKKMVDLDPENVTSREKLAELYARENMNPQALQEYRRASEYYKKHSRTDDFLRIAERISALEPNNLDLAKELAELYLSRGDQKRALGKLQLRFKADPRDIDTLRLLASAFQGLGQVSKTVSVFKELAKVYSDKGRTEDVNQIWKQIEALDPEDPEVVSRRAPAPVPPPPPPATPYAASPPARGPSPASRAAPPPPAPAPPAARVVPGPVPSPAAPPRAAPAVAPPPPTGRESLAKLLTETDVYVKYGLQEKALEHLRKVFAVDPENLDAHQKAYDIYLASGNQAQASEQLLNVLRLCTRREEVERAQPYLDTLIEQNPDHEELPTFLSVLRADAAVVELEPASDEGLVASSPGEEVVVGDVPPDALAGAPSDEVSLHTSGGEDPEELVSDEVGFEGVEFPSPGFDEPLGTVEDEALRVASSDDGEVVNEDELSSDDNAGLLEHAAHDSFVEQAGEELEGTFAGSLEGGLEGTLVQHEAPEAQASAPLEEAYAPYGEAPVEAPPEEEPAAEECDEASFFLEQGLLEEAREILETILIAFPGHARATELKERLEVFEASQGSPSEQTVQRDAFDLAAELADELGELGTEEPTDGAGSPAAGDFQYSVDEVFSEFKKGLEKVVKPEDVDTHYDLGIAYKEMGLIDDAIGEFAIARQGCLGKKKEIDCLSMSGLLQMMKGDAAAAAEAFRHALGSAHLTPDVEKGLRYELGKAHEASGYAGKALYQFQRVQELDAGYHDVETRVARLAEEAVPEEDPLPAPTIRSGAAKVELKARKAGVG